MLTAGAIAGVVLTVIAVLAALVYFRNPVERACCRPWTNLLSFRRGSGRVQYCRVRLVHSSLECLCHIIFLYLNTIHIHICYIYLFFHRLIPLRKLDFCSMLLIPRNVNRIVTTIFYMHNAVLTIFILDCRRVITEQYIIFNISINCRIKFVWKTPCKIN